MANRPTSVQQYLDSLPADRREALEAIRATIRANLDPVFEEGIQYGMIGYYVPHSVYPAGYHCDPKQPLPFASIASQKNHIGIYLLCIYTDPAENEQFQAEWRATGKRLDMGKGCVRVKRLDDLPLDVLGRAIQRISAARFIAHYESILAMRGTGRRPQRTETASTAKGAPAKKAAAKKATAKRATAKRATAKKAPSKKAPTKKAAPKKAPAKRAAAKKS